MTTTKRKTTNLIKVGKSEDWPDHRWNRLYGTEMTAVDSIKLIPEDLYKQYLQALDKLSSLKMKIDLY